MPTETITVTATVTNKIGANVRRLIVYKMAMLAVPVGSGKESFVIGLNAISSRDNLIRIAKESRIWVQAAIESVNNAPDCTFKDDEEIAEHILNEIEERNA